MLDPIPFCKQEKGREASAGRLVDAARRGMGWPLERSTAVLWGIRRRIERETRARRHPVLGASVAWAGLAAAVVTVAAALLIGGRAGTAHRASGAGMRSPTVDARPDRALGGESAAAELQRWVGASATDASPLALDPLDTTRWARLDLADIGTLELVLLQGFEVRELPDRRELRVGVGTLRAEILRQAPDRPVVVVTPHLRVVVVGTRFDVVVAPDGTEVQVLQGTVRVESGEARAVVAGGASIRSDDPRLLEPQGAAGLGDLRPASAPETRGEPRARPAHPGGTWDSRSSRCGALAAVADRKACYQRLAQGEGLTAQNALFALGVLAREFDHRDEEALELFARYGERFPQGALAPEAALRVLDLARALGRRERALAAATAFAERYPHDPRTQDVALVRAELLCADRHRWQQGWELLERLAPAVQPAAPPAPGGPGSPLRAEVERIRRRCAMQAPPGAAPVPDLRAHDSPRSRHETDD